MSTNQQKDKPAVNRPKGGVASIATLDLVATTLDKLINRRYGVESIGCLYGPSGWGKTFSTNVLAIDTRAYFVQVQPIWTKKTFLQKILDEMRIEWESKTGVPELYDMVVQQMAASQRLLILDEFNRAIERPILAQITRAIADSSQAPILLVGEEKLRRDLSKECFKQLNRRISAWAEPVDVNVDDALKLAQIYCPNIDIAPDAINTLTEFSKGSVASIVNCLNAIYESCLTQGIDSLSLSTLQKISLPYITHQRRKV